MTLRATIGAMFVLASAVPVRSEVTSQIGKRGGTVVIAAEIEAPPETVMPVILEIEERMRDVKEVRSAETYGTNEHGFSGRYALRLFGMNHTFHVSYARESDVVEFHLDPTLRNDVVAYDGAYRLEATPTGTRLHYTCTTVAETWIPPFMRERLVVGMAVDEVEGIRRRAEGR